MLNKYLADPPGNGAKRHGAKEVVRIVQDKGQADEVCRYGKRRSKEERKRRNLTMKIKYRVKKTILSCLAVLFVAVMAVSPVLQADAASYGTNGYHCTASAPKSGKLFIGDSRTCQLWNYKHKGASFVSVWGGHYGYGGSTMQIDYASQRTTMKTYAQNTIKKCGKCHIYIFATVNDYNGAGSYTSPVSNVVSLAETAYGWTAKYQGKTVHPVVHVIQLVGSKGKNVSAYNALLKSKAASSKKIKNCISISGCLAGSNGGYASDGVHYNDTTLKNIWNKL